MTGGRPQLTTKIPLSTGMRAAQQNSASRASSGAFGEAVAANTRTQGGGSQDTLQGVFVVHRNPAIASQSIQLLFRGKENPAGTCRLTSASTNLPLTFTLCSYQNKKHGTGCVPEGEGDPGRQPGRRSACATADTKQVPQLGGRVSDPTPEGHCLDGLYHHIPSTEHTSCFLNHHDSIRHIHLSTGQRSTLRCQPHLLEHNASLGGNL